MSTIMLRPEKGEREEMIATIWPVLLFLNCYLSQEWDFFCLRISFLNLGSLQQLLSAARQ